MFAYFFCNYNSLELSIVAVPQTQIAGRAFANNVRFIASFPIFTSFLFSCAIKLAVATRTVLSNGKSGGWPWIAPDLGFSCSPVTRQAALGVEHVYCPFGICQAL